MGMRMSYRGVAIAVGIFLVATEGSAQTPAPTSGPAADGSPAWYLRGSFPDPGGRTLVEPGGKVTVLTAAEANAANPNPGAVSTSPAVTTPGCRGSIVCGNRVTPGRGSLQRVTWEQTLGYTYTYPYDLPRNTGGVTAVALDSRGSLWAFQRTPVGSPQLFKFDANRNLEISIGEGVIGRQVKTHGMAVDAQDNVWIVDTNGSTIQKLSPEGRLLMTLGERGRRGDWDEARGLRLLWQPVHIAFAPNGDVYIAMGHANESPNDIDSEDPNNTIGASRILHLDRDGKFINQWYGNSVGQGKFASAHGFAIDPTNGDVWIGDREEYRIVIYNSAGQFLRTIPTRNLVCAIQFDAQGNPWMGSGQDGQFLKLDRASGRVVGAVGRGMGIGEGEITEASYFVFDSRNNLYAGDTSVGRITVMVAP